eukprot:CAMPEP_0201551780 /NCGR_PEP_ID=MMETSP0173_2-20130828/9783_1 /ASSEMBLY_ACC=CAM_ASM_000268 /TAXON_ID=218659 /ORGANISM="Vexillifera sp., Strain DIVA3 564/2" /LENGTH=114 /DNA_ID=CAMNT_0047962111 /DNA_START=24 /DNA_END=368 /DNA_ORIENTATION=+
MSSQSDPKDARKAGGARVPAANKTGHTGSNNDSTTPKTNAVAALDNKDDATRIAQIENRIADVAPAVVAAEGNNPSESKAVASTFAPPPDPKPQAKHPNRGASGVRVNQPRRMN